MDSGTTFSIGSVWVCLTSLQAALATSVDLRCYLVLKRTEGGEVTLDLPDFQHRVKWSTSALTSRPESSGEQTPIALGMRCTMFLSTSSRV